MKRFEEQLKQALARRQPSADFTRRVLARAEQERVENAQRHGWKWLEAARAWRLAGTVTAITVVITGSAVYEQHERAMRGEAAKQKLLFAVRLAGAKLHQARQQILHVEEMEQ